MSLSYLIHFPIENMSLNNLVPLICLILCLVELFFFELHLNRLGRVCKYLSISWNSMQSQFRLRDDLNAEAVKKNQDFESSNQLFCPSEKSTEEDGHLRRDDVGILMARLGFSFDPEDETVQESLSTDELSNLFEEEPSLDEVKGAFDVFDENRDGFIDAEKLQRVLCVLGFKEGLETENCRRMIRAFDENGDGRIDFGEFVKFMEKTFF